MKMAKLYFFIFFHSSNEIMATCGEFSLKINMNKGLNYYFNNQDLSEFKSFSSPIKSFCVKFNILK